MIKLALIDNVIPYYIGNKSNHKTAHKTFLASICDPSEYKGEKSFVP